MGDYLHVDEACSYLCSENLGLGVAKVPESDLGLAYAMREALLGAAATLDPNAHATTPEWPQYNTGSHTQMLFNRTADGLGSYMETFATDEAQLERCA